MNILLSLSILLFFFPMFSMDNSTCESIEDYFMLQTQLIILGDQFIKLPDYSYDEKACFIDAIKNKNLDVVKRTIDSQDKHLLVIDLIKYAEDDFFIEVIAQQTELIQDELARKHFLNILEKQEKNFFQEQSNDALIKKLMEHAEIDEIEKLNFSKDFLKDDKCLLRYYENKLLSSDIIELADKKCNALLDKLTSEVEKINRMQFNTGQRELFDKISRLANVVKNLDVHPFEKFLAREMLGHAYKTALSQDLVRTEEIKIQALNNADLFINNLITRGSAFGKGFKDGVFQRAESWIKEPHIVVKDLIVSNAKLIFDFCRMLETVDDEKDFVSMFVPEVAEKHQRDIDLFHQELHGILNTVTNFSTEEWGQTLGALMIDMVALKTAGTVGKSVLNGSALRFANTLDVIESHIPDMKVAKKVVRDIEKLIAPCKYLPAPEGISEALWDHLCFDPSHGGRSLKSAREAIMGLVAEEQMFLEGPLIRDMREKLNGEFFERAGKGRLHDVKHAWSKYFNREHFCRRIKKGLKIVESTIPENLIIDAVDLTNEHLFELINDLKVRLTPDEIKRVIVVMSNENITQLQKLGVNIPLYVPKGEDFRIILPALGGAQRLDALISDENLQAASAQSIESDPFSRLNLHSDFSLQFKNYFDFERIFPINLSNLSKADFINYAYHCNKDLGLRIFPLSQSVYQSQDEILEVESENKKLHEEIMNFNPSNISQVGFKITKPSLAQRLDREELQRSVLIALSIHAYMHDQKIREKIDQKRLYALNLLLKCIKGKDLEETVLARQQILNLRMPGWLGDDTRDFLYDIVPYLFDNNGNVSLDEPLENESTLAMIYNYLESLCVDKEDYEKMWKLLRSKNIQKLNELIDANCKLEPKFKHYEIRSAGFASDIRDLAGFGPASRRTAALQSNFNFDLFKLIQFCKEFDFKEAKKIIEKYNSKLTEKILLEKAFMTYYKRVYDEFGIIKLFVKDPLYYRLSDAHKIKLRNDDHSRNVFNRALILRDKAKKHIALNVNLKYLTEDQIYQLMDGMLKKYLD